MTKGTPKKRADKVATTAKPVALLADVRDLILRAREGVARAVDSGLTTLYWNVGRRVRRDILKERRADYGGQIVSALGRQLETEFGRGFGEKNLRRMVQFAEQFPDVQIVAALLRQFGWTHFTILLPISDPLKREFYAEMCRIERWSTRTLRAKIDGMLFERTALSRKPKKLAAMELKQLREEDKLTPDLVFRDPYLLDFLGLKDTYAEKDLEAALLREIESFLLELGAGFAFVERQKRITLDGDDYYMDLLFYHRPLRRLVVIELKIGEFKPADTGQVELYLRWLDRNERREGEEPPLAIILCAGKKQETVEYLNPLQAPIFT
ncbi:MAG: PDDEXK nuclease domain-containing protein [Candidatus Binatia bacterium]